MATISADPRFRLAKSHVSSPISEGAGGDGSAEEAAINIFAALLEESRVIHGETSLNAALCQYEYGNALFRAVVRKGERNNEKQAGEEEDDKKPAAKKESQRDIMAAAALKRSSAGDASNSTMNKRVKKEEDKSVKNEEGLKEGDAVHIKDDGQQSISTNSKGGAEDDQDDADIDLALEMMDESWTHFWRTAHVNSTQNEQSDQQKQQKQWALEQEPKVLEAMGEVYYYRGEYANAVDSNIRAIDLREEAWEHLKQAHAQNDGSDETESWTVEDLQCQRRLVDTYVLLAYALLACPKGEDVVCYLDDIEEDGASAVAVQGPEETQGKKLVNANDLLGFALSYYESARRGLDEILLRYGKMAAAKMEVGDEKEDITYLALKVMDLEKQVHNQK